MNKSNQTKVVWFESLFERSAEWPKVRHNLRFVCLPRKLVMRKLSKVFSDSRQFSFTYVWQLNSNYVWKFVSGGHRPSIRKEKLWKPVSKNIFCQKLTPGVPSSGFQRQLLCVVVCLAFRVWWYENEANPITSTRGGKSSRNQTNQKTICLNRQRTSTRKLESAESQWIGANFIRPIFKSSRHESSCIGPGRILRI